MKMIYLNNLHVEFRKRSIAIKYLWTNVLVSFLNARLFFIKSRSFVDSVIFFSQFNHNVYLILIASVIMYVLKYCLMIAITKVYLNIDFIFARRDISFYNNLNFCFKYLSSSSLFNNVIFADWIDRLFFF